MTDDRRDDLKKIARGIKIVVLDVDGVLTDGKIIVNDDGVESKHFNVRDGMAIALGIKQGLLFALISGRYSKVVEHRSQELGIHDVYQNVSDKVKALETVLQKHTIAAENAAFMGDDINDVPAMELVGLSAAPADADDAVKEKALLVSSRRGGEGAVREVVEFIMQEQKTWGW